MTGADVELVRHLVYAGTAVTDAEIRWLFALDAESEGRDNDPAWGDLFVKAALCHVMGRRTPAALEADVMLVRQARLAGPRPQVTPLSVLKSLLSGGFAAYKARLSQPGWVEALEKRYDEVNAGAEADARLTAAEAAALLGLSEADGKLTVNEQALLAELRKLEAEQG
jgi:hypothetical protein